jgi:hypothetical protein
MHPMASGTDHRPSPEVHHWSSKLFSSEQLNPDIQVNLASKESAYDAEKMRPKLSQDEYNRCM